MTKLNTINLRTLPSRNSFICAKTTKATTTNFTPSLSLTNIDNMRANIFM